MSQRKHTNHDHQKIAILQQIGKKIDGIYQWLNTFHESQRDALQQSVGPHFTSLLHDQLALEAYFFFTDWIRCCKALSLATYYYSPIKEIKHVCEKLIYIAPEVQLRAAAILSLANCHAGTNSQRIGRIFASLVSDESNDVILRQSAYLSLFILRGEPYFSPMDSYDKDPFDALRIPEDVNWDIINSYMN